jgi:hypothetical protein
VNSYWNSKARPTSSNRPKAFLATVFENKELLVSWRLDALKLMRKFEAAKVAPQTVRAARRDGDRREAWRRYEISQLHWKLSLAIKDTPPLDGQTTYIPPTT